MRSARGALLAVSLLASGCAVGVTRPIEAEGLPERVAQADAAYRAGQVEAALAAYIALSDQVPAEPTFWARRGHLHFAAGQRDDAVVAYQRALLLVPSYPEVLRNLATLHVGRAAEYLQQALAGETLSAHERDALLRYLNALNVTREVAHDAR